jgi:hypothetical protein
MRLTTRNTWCSHMHRPCAEVDVRGQRRASIRHTEVMRKIWLIDSWKGKWHVRLEKRVRGYREVDQITWQQRHTSQLNWYQSCFLIKSFRFQIYARKSATLSLLCLSLVLQRSCGSQMGPRPYSFMLLLFTIHLTSRWATDGIVK